MPASSQIFTSKEDTAMQEALMSDSSSSLSYGGQADATLKQKKRKKDKSFIARTCQVLSIPVHKRKAKMFSRKKRMSQIIPHHFSTIFWDLAAPEP